MRYEIKMVAVALIILSIAIPVAFAEEIGSVLNPPTVKVVYDGETPIKDTIDAKIAIENAKWFWEEKTPVNNVTEYGLAAKTSMEKLTYPYELPKPEGAKGAVTVVKIQKCRYDEATQTMWYWIEATRDGQEVAVDNPIWAYPAPKDVMVSLVKDDLKNEITITKKEDPQAAITEVLTQYVDRQPLGKAKVGTKE